MNTWAADTVFVLDQVEELNKSSESLAGHLDIAEVGVFGHSFGGAVDGMVCLQDSRFKAGINMDGIQFDQHTYTDASSMQIPFMEVTSDDIIPGINDFMYSRINNRFYQLHIKGSKHNNFTDMPLFSPLLRKTKLLSCGCVDPFKMRKTVDSYILAFFDTYLKNKPSALLNYPDTQIPEIEFNVHEPEYLP
jgi:predicted dienelactone hydrolase